MRAQSFPCKHLILASMCCEVSFILFGNNVLAYGDNVMPTMVE